MKVTVTLSTEDVAGLEELIDLAHRGRQDYLYQAEWGDYTDEDVRLARQRWKSAQKVAKTLQGQLGHRSI